MSRLGIVALALLFPCSTFSQSPPVKMGLWEKKISSPGITGELGTITSKVCVTPETWQRMASHALRQRPGCSVTNSQTERRYTSSLSCKKDHGVTLNVSSTSEIQDAEHVVSETHAVTAWSGKSRDIVTNMTITFVSASCGEVQPDEPVVDGK